MTWLNRDKQQAKTKLRALHDAHVSLQQQAANSSIATVKGEFAGVRGYVLCYMSFSRTSSDSGLLPSKHRPPTL